MKLDIEKLEIEMARNCMGKKDLAEKTGLSPGVISLYFSRGSATPTGIGRLAKALGVDVIAILPDKQKGDKGV